MDSLMWQLILIVVLLAMSAFFSATETAYSSINRARLKSLGDRGNRRAAETLGLVDRYDELLSTVLVGNNIVNIGIASVGTVMFVGWMGNAGAGVSTAVITVMVLIFGEVSPKSLAKENPERFAMAVCPIIRMFMCVFHPINWLFSRLKALLNRMVGVHDEQSLTQDELLTLVEEAEQEGGMNAEESELLKSAIEFHDVDVSDILTPRVRVEGVPLESTVKEVADAFEQSGYSRLPVYEETLDHIVGVVHQKDFIRRVRAGGPFSLSEIMKKPVYVAPGAHIGDTLRLMQKTRSQLAVVTDEYGGTMGILTMEDILEELVGDIWDEHDEVEVPFRMLEDGVCRASGSAEPEDVFECLGISPKTEAVTMSGWAMEMLQRVPVAGDSFEAEGWRVTVLSTDGPHAQELELRRVEPAQGACQTVAP